MEIQKELRDFIKRVILAFEIGKTVMDYDDIFIYNDGPGKTKQITLSFGLTSSGNLKPFLEEYIAAKGMFANHFVPYLPLIKKSSIVNNTDFKNLLKKAAREDQVFRDEMDEAYCDYYFKPALKWAEEHGFTLPLSLMVIVDSFIHSGSILPLLRVRFPEYVPARGGNEKQWINQYLRARESWLRNHSNKILRGTAVRARTYLTQIQKGNWDLSERPINCNGINVS